jgi:hypothetical protein
MSDAARRPTLTLSRPPPVVAPSLPNLKVVVPERRVAGTPAPSYWSPPDKYAGSLLGWCVRRRDYDVHRQFFVTAGRCLQHGELQYLTAQIVRGEATEIEGGEWAGWYRVNSMDDRPLVAKIYRPSVHGPSYVPLIFNYLTASPFAAPLPLTPDRSARRGQTRGRPRKSQETDGLEKLSQ